MADLRNVSTSYPKAEVLNAFMRGVYQWMSAGLGLTAVTAYLTISTPALINILQANPTLLFVLIFAELGLVIAMSAAIHKFSALTATALFMLYSGLNGVTIAPLLLIYTGASVAGTFFIFAGMFGAMSVYGLTTKKDLSSWGSFLFMGLIGIILASIVNIFLQSSMLHFAVSGIGVLVFGCLPFSLISLSRQRHRRPGVCRPHGL